MKIRGCFEPLFGRIESSLPWVAIFWGGSPLQGSGFLWGVYPGLRLGGLAFDLGCWSRPDRAKEAWENGFGCGAEVSATGTNPGTYAARHTLTDRWG